MSALPSIGKSETSSWRSDARTPLMSTVLYACSAPFPMSCASTRGGLWARSVSNTFHSPAGLPSNRVPTWNSEGRVSGESLSKVHTRVVLSSEDPAAATAIMGMIMRRIRWASLIMPIARSLLPSRDGRTFQMEENCSCFAPWIAPIDRSPCRRDRFRRRARCVLRDIEPHGSWGRASAP